MSAAAHAPLTPDADPVLPSFQDRPASRRAEINRTNSLHSTGPRTEAGKQRSSLNALSHGLTARTPVLPTEDQAEYQRHVQLLLDEYQPATPTETALVHELADTAWRLKRVPLLEAGLLSRAMHPPNEQAAVEFDIVDAHRALATIGMHGQRLSRQFHKALQQLRLIQEERRAEERRQLRLAAIQWIHHRHKGLPFHPAAAGFVLPEKKIERAALQILNQNEAFLNGWVRFPTRRTHSQAARFDEDSAAQNIRANADDAGFVQALLLKATTARP